MKRDRKEEIEAAKHDWEALTAELSRRGGRKTRRRFIRQEDNPETDREQVATKATMLEKRGRVEEPLRFIFGGDATRADRRAGTTGNAQLREIIAAPSNACWKY
jgi:hypothetical protein